MPRVLDLSSRVASTSYAYGWCFSGILCSAALGERGVGEVCQCPNSYCHCCSGVCVCVCVCV